MDITYYIDGKSLSDFGVFVSASEGIISRPKPKEPVSQSWKEYHGEVVDLTKRLYEKRKIFLECFIKAGSKEDYIEKLNTFLKVFDATGTRRLMVSVGASKPLVFEVYLSGEIDPKKKWKDGTMAGVFKLELTEPSPIKRVVQINGTSLSITITSSKLVDIFWGDGSVTRDISGTAQVSTHTYANDWTYYAIVAGNIDEITAFSTTGIIIWNKL